MPAAYRFGRASDASLIQLVADLIKAVGEAKAIISLGEIHFHLDSSGSVPSTYDGVFTRDTYLIQSMTIQWEAIQANLYFQRAQTIQGNSWVANNGFVDGIQLTGPSVTPETFFPAFARAISAFVSLAPPAALGDGGAASLEHSATILTGLNNAIASLVDHTAARQAALDDERLKLAEESRADLQRQRDELTASMASRADTLKIQAATLTAREAELDDRANTHVRREIQREMAALTEGRLKAGLLRQSRVEYLTSLGLTILGIALVGFVIYREIGYIEGISTSIAKLIPDPMIATAAKPGLIANLNAQVMYAQIRIGLQTLGLAALIWFGLRTASARYRQVSRWERELHKFRLDTERAGFLVEGDLEARKVNQVGLPDVLLQSFSRGLFSGSDQGDTAGGGNENVGDALTALLGQAAKVQVGNGGVSVEIDRKGVVKARKELSGTTED
jgi:hypothetical protein